MKILLSEDDIISRFIIESILRKDGHTLYICENGKEASSVLKNNAKYYDLILTDIMMPLMNGFELAKFIKVDLSLTVPLVAITSYERNHFSEAELIYFDGWIQKPIIRENILNEIHNIFRRKNDITIKYHSDKFKK